METTQILESNQARLISCFDHYLFSASVFTVNMGTLISYLARETIGIRGDICKASSTGLVVCIGWGLMNGSHS